MSPALPEWVWHLHASLFRHAIAFSFGPTPRPRRQLEIHSGTAFLLDLGVRPLVVTAGHVTDEIIRTVEEDPTSLVMLGNHRVTIAPSDIFRSATIDLAVISVSDQLATALQQDFGVVRPPTWPPPEVVAEDPVIFPGFPGAGRIVSSWSDVDFLGTTSLAIIHNVHRDEFVCHLDPQYIEERRDPTTQDDLPETAVGGLSGAPAFLVRNRDPSVLVVPQLCGVMKEGGGALLGPGHRIVYFTRLDRLRPDGTCS